MAAIKKAATPDAYLAKLPAERRPIIAALRKFVKRHLPKGYVESMTWGVPCYEIPLARYPNTYNGKPLSIVALGAQKNYCSLYLMCAYGSKKREKELRDAFKKAGKKLDMGKACIRFKTLDDLELGVIGKLIAAVPVEKYIEVYEASRPKARTRKKTTAPS